MIISLLHVKNFFIRSSNAWIENSNDLVEESSWLLQLIIENIIAVAWKRCIKQIRSQYDLIIYELSRLSTIQGCKNALSQIFYSSLWYENFLATMRWFISLIPVFRSFIIQIESSKWWDNDSLCISPNLCILPLN